MNYRSFFSVIAVFVGFVLFLFTSSISPVFVKQ